MLSATRMNTHVTHTIKLSLIGETGVGKSSVAMRFASGSITQFTETTIGAAYLSKLLELAGGVSEGRQLKAVIPGGSSVPVIKGETMMSVDMDYDSISKAGSMLGSGAVIVMDETADMVKVLQRISRFYYE